MLIDDWYLFCCMRTWHNSCDASYLAEDGQQHYVSEIMNLVRLHQAAEQPTLTCLRSSSPIKCSFVMEVRGWATILLSSTV